ncbi:MAG: hypothetical protein J6C33_09700 [Lachnospiraceae bacterium]|nr:hypothetical protein [Lachnospiraceae bacterium]
MEKHYKAVRNHKDTVFRLLFADKKELLTLYNALNGTDYHDPQRLRMYTLENAIYMNVKNDVSFLLDAELNLYEQQSTYNPNMPLRNLIYIARQLESYIRMESIYSSKPVRIPVPRFVVFYNGTRKQPEQKILRLSDSFEKEIAEPELELKVLMLNLGSGQNKKLLEKCATLKEYCLFVERIRSYAARLPLEEAVERAVTECIRENILADFLIKQRSEVIAMSIFEYNEEEELKKIRADERELGKAEGKAEDILSLLEKLGPVPASLHERIMSETSLELLGQWLIDAARADSVEAFAKRLPPS